MKTKYDKTHFVPRKCERNLYLNRQKVNEKQQQQI